MSMFTPDVQSIGYERPVSAGPSAVEGLANVLGVGLSLATKPERKESSYTEKKDIRDQSLLIGLQNSLTKVSEVRSQKGERAATLVEKEILLNFSRAGGNLNDPTVQESISLAMGKPFEFVGRSPEEVAVASVVQTKEYSDGILAGKVALGSEATTQDLHNYALTYIGRSVALENTILSDNWQWTQRGDGRQAEEFIDQFAQTNLGSLMVAAEAGQLITFENFASVKANWSVTKARLMGKKPKDEKLWAPIQARIDATEEVIAFLESMTYGAGKKGIEAKALSAIGQSLFGLIEEGTIDKFTGSAIARTMVSNPEVFFETGAIPLTDLKAVLEAAAKTSVVSTDPAVDPDQAVQDNYEQFSDMGALDKVTEAATLSSTATKVAGAPNTDDVVYESLVKAFNAMSSLGFKDERFASVKGVSDVFNGSVVKAIEKIGQTDAVRAERLAQLGFKALDQQYAVASAALVAMGQENGLVVNQQTGEISVDTSRPLRGLDERALSVLIPAAEKYYSGNFEAMIRDGGKAMTSLADRDAQYAVSVLRARSSQIQSLNSAIVRLNDQRKLIETIDKKRLEFKTLSDSYLDLEPEGQGGGGGGGGETAQTGNELTLDLIRQKEGFREKAYWDVNAWRTGYGSDTVTRADGTVEKVTENTVVTREDAERDLARRTREFQLAASRKIGTDIWTNMPGNVTAALTSIAYNYGSIPDRLLKSARSGDWEALATAVEGLAGDNRGINRARRMREAAIIRGKELPPSAAPVFAGRPTTREGTPEVRAENLITPELQVSDGVEVTSRATESVPEGDSQAPEGGGSQEPSQAALRAAKQEFSTLSAKTKAMLIRVLGGEEEVIRMIANEEVSTEGMD